MNRERLSLLCSILGGIGTVGLLVSGVLPHYKVLPLVGSLSLLVISFSAILGIVGMAASVLLANPMKRETWTYGITALVYGASFLGFIISLIGAQGNRVSWWVPLIFGVLLVGSSLLLPVVDRWRKQSSLKGE